MPYHYRFYVDRPIVEKGGVSTGGDHVRVIDIEADEMGIEAARGVADKQLKKNEEITSQAQIVIDNPGDPNAAAMHFGKVPNRKGIWVERGGEDSP